MNRTFAFLEKHLLQNKLQFRFDKEAKVFCVLVPVDKAVLNANVFFDHGLLCIATYFPFKVKPRRRAIVADLCNRINMILLHGQFSINMEDGGLRHFCSLPVDDDTIEEERFTTTFTIQLLTLTPIIEDALDALTMATMNGKTAKQGFAVLKRRLNARRKEEPVSKELLDMDAVSPN